MSVLVISYALMALAQMQGGLILQLLHGDEASRRALAEMASQTIQPDLDYRQLCREYSAAHFHSTSNVLHAVGMVATMWLVVYAATLSLLGFGNPKHFLYIPPLYYLPAWIGHFVFQKDIPAVFSYGTTIDGWVNGESCGWEDLFRGRTITNSTEFTYTVASTVLLLGTLMSVGGLWPSVAASSRPNGRPKKE